MRLRPLLRWIAFSMTLGVSLTAVSEVQSAEKYAAIEIGGSNVKYVRIDVENDGGNLRLVEAGDSKVANPGLAADLGATGKFDEKAIERTADAVAAFFQELTSDLGVPDENVAIVGSSGLVEAKNRQQLVAAVQRRTGRSMDFITAEDEVRYTLLGVVPDKNLFAASLVDVGSSNTKWGHLDAADKAPPYAMVAAHIPWGSKSLEGAVTEKAGAFAKPAAYLKQAVAARKRISREIREQLEASKMTPHDVCYLSGGAVWAMVTLVKPESAAEEYVRLTADDFRRFERQLTPQGAELFDVDLGIVKDAETRERAANDLATVGKVFRPEQIVAGGQILIALADEFGWKRPEKEVYFARSGYKAWLSGYLKEFVLKKSGGAKAAAAPAKRDTRIDVPVRCSSFSDALEK